MEARIRTVAILGAGNGGYAGAADIADRGLTVHLFSRNLATLQPILEPAVWNSPAASSLMAQECFPPRLPLERRWGWQIRPVQTRAESFQEGYSRE